MNVIWRAACAAVLIAAWTLTTGCGDVYRPIATPSPTTTGNPSGPETEVVLTCCLSQSSINSSSPVPSSVLTELDVSGDSNTGNKVVNNVTGNVTVTPSGAYIPHVPPPGTAFTAPLSFDATRSTVYTANTITDSVTATTLSNTSGSFSSTSTTINLEKGSAPINFSFEFFGLSYTQNYVVNSGTTATCPNGGSIGIIAQSSQLLVATVCLDQQASNPALQTHASPVLAWPYIDLSKAFVLDTANNQVYVVSASQHKVTNIIKLGSGTGPVKMSQSNDGRYLYTLNGGNNTLTIIDGQAETILGAPISVNLNSGSSSALIDITQDSNINDTSLTNTEVHHVWVLQADGTVSVYDNTTAGTLNYVTSVATITPAQLTAGALATNLGLLRDGTMAYVGVGGTDQVVAVNPALLSKTGVTPGINSGAPNAATTPITVGVHRTVNTTLSNPTLPSGPTSAAVLTETTVPVVAQIAVSRGGSSSDLSKAYAITTTSTTYFCYDDTINSITKSFNSISCSSTNPWASGTTIVAGNPPSTTPFLVPNCTDNGNGSMTCPNLYNGTAVIAAASQGSVTTTTGITPGAAINTYVTTIPAPFVVSYCDAAELGNGSYDAPKNCPLLLPMAVLGRN